MMNSMARRAMIALSNSYEVWVIGGGGGGGFDIGGGGGAGQITVGWVDLSPGKTIVFFVGMEGNGGSSGVPATAGGSSGFAGLTATGGGGGGSVSGIGLTGASSGGDAGRVSGTVSPRTLGTSPTSQYRGGIYFNSGTISGGAGGGGMDTNGVDATASTGGAGGGGRYIISSIPSHIGWGGCGGGSGQTGLLITPGTGLTGSGGQAVKGDNPSGVDYGSGGHGGGRTSTGLGRIGGSGNPGAIIIWCPIEVPGNWDTSSFYLETGNRGESILIANSSGILYT